MTVPSNTPSTTEWRAGGTDLSERRRAGLARGPISDIAPAVGMTEITWSADGAARIGALVTIAAIAADPRIAAAYPGIAQTAIGLATPQIRHVGTLGGNLAQHTRCWYYRNPHIACLKKGGPTCPARDGNHLYGVAFDLGPCVAPHPSSMAVALLAYDATVTTDQRAGLTVAELLGDGSNGSSAHALKPDEQINAVDLPPPVANEKALYKRAIGRAYAEWPLVELVARVVIDNGAVQHSRLVAGGVAPIPMRLLHSESAVQGAILNTQSILQAASLAGFGANPLPMTGYKLTLLSGLIQDLLERMQ